MTRRLLTIPVFVIVELLLTSISYSQTALVDSIINKRKIREIIEFLASDSLKGRLTGSNEALIAANFIQDAFRNAGLQPFDSTGYLQQFYAGKKYGNGYNVIGVLPGAPNVSEVVIFSAHYDHVGTASTNPYSSIDSRKSVRGADTIFNGANDNASGTAALISLADYFGSLRRNNRTIIFIAFSGEELGLIGSMFTVSTISDPSLISCLVNLEMLGRGIRPFITGSEYGNLQYFLNEELASINKRRYRKHFFMRDPYPEQSLFKRSDNLPFAKFRIPAHTIMVTNGADVFYHSPDDEPSTLDFGIIRDVTKALALAMQPIIDGRISPNRIDITDNR